MKRYYPLVAVLARVSLLFLGITLLRASEAKAEPPQQYPIMDKVADKIIQKYQTSTAEGSGTTTATNAYGGSATHYAGVGTVGTTSSGQTAYASTHYYGGTYGAAYHPPVAAVPYYGAYHPLVVVNSYSTGCYNCGGWAVAGAAVAGAVVGATVATANANANTAAANAAAANAYTQGYVAGTTTSAGSTSAAVANANAAAANANAAAANANAAAVNASYSMGEIVAAIPAGCAVPVVNGTTYYLCCNTWFTASYSANGVFYRVVPTP
jgi:hypothetical protein